MECVHCTACMDACDNVMTKIGAPRGLIRYASLNGIERGEPLALHAAPRRLLRRAARADGAAGGDDCSRAPMSRPPCCARPARCFNRCPTAISAISTRSASSTKPRAKCRWNCAWKISAGQLAGDGRASIVVPPQKLAGKFRADRTRSGRDEIRHHAAGHRRLFRRQKTADPQNGLHRPAQIKL